MRRKLPLVLLPVFALSLLSVAGCGDDTTSPPRDAILARWNVTSFATTDTDFITQGMTLVVDLSNADMYELEVTNDLVGICSDQKSSDCTSTGPYSYTSTELTFDPGTEDATTFDYTISGSVMTLSGAIDGTAVTIALQLAS